MPRFARWSTAVAVAALVLGTLSVAVVRAAGVNRPGADLSQAAGATKPAQQTAGNIPPIVVQDQSAERTREEFIALLRKFAPALRQTLKLDPTLMSSQTYLATYPQLVQYLQQHPEIARNPTYYLEGVRMPDNPDDNRSYYSESPSSRLIRSLIDGIGVLIIFGTITGAIIWMLKTLVDSRRWNKLARVQADAHNKLLDRFSANSELIAYIESPAGQQFLQGAPIQVDAPAPKRFGAPFGRILWSVQAGIVLAAAGFAFRIISGNVEPDAVQSFSALGTLGIYLGIGFVVSALISYVLSKQLGLLQPIAPVQPHAIARLARGAERQVHNVRQRVQPCSRMT